MLKAKSEEEKMELLQLLNQEYILMANSIEFH